MQAMKKRGQSGEVLALTLEKLNKNELAVLRTLNAEGVGDRPPMKIAEVMLANSWHIPDKAKGNSRVRNSLRKLVRGQWVEHAKSIGDGTVRITELGRAALGRTVSTPHPVPITSARATAMRFDQTLIEKFKKADCAFYNACLDQAISGNWPGFSCADCMAYQEPTPEAKMRDLVRLRAIRMASDMVEKFGNAGRVRGVKPGADAKRPEEETAPISAAFREE